MIRPVEKSDESVYIALAKEFYSSDAVLHNIDEKYICRAFREITRPSPYAEGFLFFDGDEVAGYGLIAKAFSQEHGGPLVWIDEVYVRAPYRGKGLGKEFFEYIFERYKDSAFRLETEKDNERARKLYGQLGFEELGYLQMVRKNKSNF